MLTIYMYHVNVVWKNQVIIGEPSQARLICPHIYAAHHIPQNHLLDWPRDHLSVDELCRQSSLQVGGLSLRHHMDWTHLLPAQHVHYEPLRFSHGEWHQSVSMLYHRICAPSWHDCIVWHGRTWSFGSRLSITVNKPSNASRLFAATLDKVYFYFFSFSHQTFCCVPTVCGPTCSVLAQLSKCLL